MSTALPIDLDLADLEGALEEASEAIVDLAEIASYTDTLRKELLDVLLNIASVRTTIQRAIDACSGEKQEGSGS